MLVGSIGLVASVPITTALAAAVLGPGDDPRGHDHGDGGLDQGWGAGIDGARNGHRRGRRGRSRPAMPRRAGPRRRPAAPPAVTPEG